MTERREVTIVLTWVRGVLSWHSIAIVFFDEGSLAARHSLTDGVLRLVDARAGSIRIL